MLVLAYRNEVHHHYCARLSAHIGRCSLLPTRKDVDGDTRVEALISILEFTPPKNEAEGGRVVDKKYTIPPAFPYFARDSIYQQQEKPNILTDRQL